jgi:DNA-directed RNA polymerase specialized sigma subunit
MSTPLNSKQRKLVEDRVGLARAIGHRAWKRLSGYERDEIIAYAYDGLVAAASRWEVYCEEHGFEAYEGDAQSWFDTYASRRINGAIIDALRSSDPATRRERALIKQIIGSGVNLSSQWEHEPAETIAKRAGMTVADVNRALQALVRMPVSMEETTEELWPADPEDVAESALHNGLCGAVVGVLRGLPELHQQVVAMAYYLGLEDSEIVLRIPELRYDSNALRWVEVIRDQAVERITAVLRRELRPDGPQWAEAS